MMVVCLPETTYHPEAVWLPAIVNIDLLSLLNSGGFIHGSIKPRGGFTILNNLPEAVSHILIFPLSNSASDIVKTYLLSGLNPAYIQIPPLPNCSMLLAPFNVLSNFPLCVSQIIAVLSWDTETIYFPSGLNFAISTVKECPFKSLNK